MQRGQGVSSVRSAQRVQRECRGGRVYGGVCQGYRGVQNRGCRVCAEGAEGVSCAVCSLSWVVYGGCALYRIFGAMRLTWFK